VRRAAAKAAADAEKDDPSLTTRRHVSKPSPCLPGSREPVRNREAVSEAETGARHVPRAAAWTFLRPTRANTIAAARPGVREWRAGSKGKSKLRRGFRFPELKIYRANNPQSANPTVTKRRGRHSPPPSPHATALGSEDAACGLWTPGARPAHVRPRAAHGHGRATAAARPRPKRTGELVVRALPVRRPRR
jgi:hypothetical protein